MQEIEIISESPLTLSEMREKLEKIDKEKLSFRSKKAFDYLKLFGKIKLEKVKEKKKKLEELNIQRLKERHIVKLIDLDPKDEDSVKVVLSSESITLKQEEIKQILEAIK